MNPMLTKPNLLMHRIRHALTPTAGVLCLFATALLLAPCAHAQLDTPEAAKRVEKHPEPDLYSLKFDGDHVDELGQRLKSEFPNDNVVIAPSAREIPLYAFEVRNVRLQEIGKTIEFLSEGRLTVDVVPREKGTIGNIWRIASRSAAGPAATANLKMRSVAAPDLFSNEENLDRIIAEANELEDFRLRSILESASVRGGDFSGVTKTKIRALRSQKVFVLVGNEDGVAGVESFIKAAQQLNVDLATEKRMLAASLAPKMRSVLAPHLFANEKRLDQITKEFQYVQGLWSDWHEQVMQIAGIDDGRGGVCVQWRPEQKLFVLIGSDEGIAGMESLIQAAEKNAAEQDAIQSEAMAKVNELKHQLDVAKRKMEFEERVKIERKENLIDKIAQTKKALELRKQDGAVHSPEEWRKLVAETDAEIKNIEKALDEGDSRSSEQIEQLKRSFLEIEARLDAARSQARLKE